MAAWVYRTVTGGRTVLWVGEDVANNYQSLWTTSSGAVAYSHDGTQGQAYSTTGMSLNKWHHACATFTSDTLRAAFVDGGGKGTNTTSVTPVPPTFEYTRIGAYKSPNTTENFAGAVCEVGLWDVVLSDYEIWRLAHGRFPWEIRPQNLVGYWLPVGANNDRDYSGRGNHLTPYNTPTWTAAPRRLTDALMQRKIWGAQRFAKAPVVGAPGLPWLREMRRRLVRWDRPIHQLQL